MGCKLQDANTYAILYGADRFLTTYLVTEGHGCSSHYVYIAFANNKDNDFKAAGIVSEDGNVACPVYGRADVSRSNSGAPFGGKEVDTGSERTRHC
jgi:hypothetical protein